MKILFIVFHYLGIITGITGCLFAWYDDFICKKIIRLTAGKFVCLTRDEMRPFPWSKWHKLGVLIRWEGTDIEVKSMAQKVLKSNKISLRLILAGLAMFFLAKLMYLALLIGK